MAAKRHLACVAAPYGLSQRRESIRCAECRGPRHLLAAPAHAQRLRHRRLVDGLHRPRLLQPQGQRIRPPGRRRHLAPLPQCLPARLGERCLRPPACGNARQAGVYHDPLGLCRTAALRFRSVERRRGLFMGHAAQADSARSELRHDRMSQLQHRHRRILLRLLQHRRTRLGAAQSAVSGALCAVDAICPVLSGIP